MTLFTEKQLGDIKFPEKPETVMYASTKHVCYTTKENKTFCVDVDNPSTHTLLPTPDGEFRVSRNRAHPIIAVYNHLGTDVLVYDLHEKRVIKQMKYTKVVDVEWASSNTLAITSEFSSYLWSIGDSTDPVKLQVPSTWDTCLATDSAKQWMLLGNNSYDGITDTCLYSVESQALQKVRADVASFFNVAGNSSLFLATAYRDSVTECIKFSVLDVTKTIVKHETTIALDAWPKIIHVSTKNMIAYLQCGTIGSLTVCDLWTGTPIGHHSIYGAYQEDLEAFVYCEYYSGKHCFNLIDERVLESRRAVMDTTHPFQIKHENSIETININLIQSAKKLKKSNPLLASAYSMVALNEAKSRLSQSEEEELKQIISSSEKKEKKKRVDLEKEKKSLERKVAELEEQKKNIEERAKAIEQHFKDKLPQVISDTKAKEEVQERLERVRKETVEAQEKISAAKNEEEKKELRMKRETLEKEKQALDRRVVELQEREQKMEEREKVFKQHYNKWKSVAQANLAVINKKQADDLFRQVVVANNDVVKDKEELADKLARAEELREKLQESEKVLKQKVECLQNYLAIVEKQGLLPEAVCFKRLLKAVKRLNLPKVKCFISYAWSPDKSNNAVLQAKLLKMKGDLRKTGIEVMLDITNMEGDIDEYMLRGIDTSYRVLLICTPRLRERAGEQKANNLQKELNAALSRQKVDPKFIVPLVLEGDRDTSIPMNLPNILSMDFSKPEQYCELMTSLTPKGLIPLLFGLDDNHLYAELLRGYHAQVELLQIKQPRP